MCNHFKVKYKKHDQIRQFTHTPLANSCYKDGVVYYPMVDNHKGLTHDDASQPKRMQVLFYYETLTSFWLSILDMSYIFLVVKCCIGER